MEVQSVRGKKQVGEMRFVSGDGKATKYPPSVVIDNHYCSRYVAALENLETVEIMIHGEVTKHNYHR